MFVSSCHVEPYLFVLLECLATETRITNKELANRGAGACSAVNTHGRVCAYGMGEPLKMDGQRETDTLSAGGFRYQTVHCGLTANLVSQDRG